MIYANSHNTEIRGRLKLRSTARGANNRLDVESIVSFDKADGISVPVLGGLPTCILGDRCMPCIAFTAAGFGLCTYELRQPEKMCVSEV